MVNVLASNFVGAPIPYLDRLIGFRASLLPASLFAVLIFADRLLPDNRGGASSSELTDIVGFGNLETKLDSFIQDGSHSTKHIPRASFF